MFETTKFKYEREKFREFLEKQMGKSCGTAHSYASYLDNVSELLGKEIDNLASTDEAINEELRMLRVLEKGRFSSALKYLYRFYHDKVPQLKSREDRVIADDELQAIACLDLETKIYRYMPTERYYDLIENRRNALTHISHWEDPYEGFIYRGGLNVCADGGVQDRIYDLYKYVYGQSWTLQHGESDVLWRAMANGKRGDLVRVKTNVRKLAQSLLQNVNSPSVFAGQFRIAPIEYKPEAKFNMELNGDNLARLLNGDVECKLGFLFFKREEFSLEQEVRVVILADSCCIDFSKCKRGDLLKFEVDPNDLIEEVLVDPCMKRRDYEQLVCRTKFAVPELHFEKIRRSSLFDWPVIR